MATPDEIPTDLTLEVGENLSPDRFMAAARAFFGYVEEVTKAVEVGDERVQWVVRIREGSHLIGVDPLSSGPPAPVAVYSEVAHGIERLAAGELEGAGLSQPALRHLRVLSEFTDGTRGKPVPIRVWVRKKPITVNPEIAHVIREDERLAYDAYGTVEGRLRAIQDNKGIKLEVRDDLLGVTVDCYVPDGMLPLAFQSFRRRVEVTGKIHYRRNGRPASIEVAKIDPLPDDADLPTADDVRGILRAVG